MTDLLAAPIEMTLSLADWGWRRRSDTLRLATYRTGQRSSQLILGR